MRNVMSFTQRMVKLAEYVGWRVVVLLIGRVGGGADDRQP